MLVTLILTFGPISGAHMNPVVTVADASHGGTPWREVPVYVAAQIVGGLVGAACAHLMFGKPLFFASQHVRAGGAQLFSEFVATFGLLSVIWGTSRSRPDGDAVRRRRLHHGRVLVHGVDVVRQPGRDDRARGQRHVRGHSARRCRRVSSPLRPSAPRPRRCSFDGWFPRRRPFIPTS